LDWIELTWPMVSVIFNLLFLTAQSWLGMQTSATLYFNLCRFRWEQDDTVVSWWEDWPLFLCLCDVFQRFVSALVNRQGR